MQAWQDAISRWHRLNITTKFTAAYSFLLLVFFLVSITGYFLLISAQRRTDNAILNSTHVQNLILEMDRDMRNARILQRDFFMRYPLVGYEIARVTYAMPAQDEIAKVLTLSQELQDVTSQGDTSEKFRENRVSLNLYLAAADRYETTFIEAVDLVTQLADPKDGQLQALSGQADLIEAKLTEAGELSLLLAYWEMRDLEQTYLLTRQRPYMQSAFNVIATIKEDVSQTNSLTTNEQAEIVTLLDTYQEIAEEILLLDVKLRGKLTDFDLQAQTIDPISLELIELASSEIQYAQEQVERTSQLATTTLIITAVTGLLAASFIAKLINSSVTQNILHLKAFTEAYQAGQRDVTLDIPNEDELGQLATSFQTMANHTNTLINDLEMNVAELQKTEQALRASEHRFQSVFQQAAVGIGILSLDGNWIQVNPMICNITGYAKEELFERPFLEILHPEEIKDEQRISQSLLSRQQERSYIATRLIHKNGEPIWVNQFTTVVQSPDHTEDYFILILDDITERIQLELQLRQSQKMEAIGQLAGGIAHDFNNLLTIIMSYSDLLLITNGDTSERTMNRIQEIKDAGLRASALTNQLLTFSRRQVLKMEILDLNKIILNMANMLSRLIGENIELVTRLTDSALAIKADLSQIEQIILNLAINARDAMPQGGRLVIETENVYIDSPYAMQKIDLEPGNYLMLAVSDNGMGMDEAVQAKIFEPFFTTKEVGKGTGLGLATVHGIVNQLGGQIWVYSEEDHGTTFKIYLPTVAEPVERDVVHVSPETFAGDETILLVEDDAPVQELVFHLLTSNGYDVLLADSYSAEPLSLKHERPIDVLLTDVVMPGINGRKLAENLLKIHPEMKVVFMSGYTDDIIIQQGILRQDIPFLQKPFTAVQLLRMIRSVCDDVELSY